MRIVRSAALMLFVSLMIILTACQSEVPSQVSDGNVPSLPVLPTLPPATVASTPTELIPYPITPNPTWTPVATLPSEIYKQNLIGLFSTNGGCDFPCWWGVRPGDSVQKVFDLAPVIGESLHPFGSVYYFTFSLGNLNTPDLDVNFYIDTNQIVQTIYVRLDQPSRFNDYTNAFQERLSLTNLLSDYGKPHDVLLLVEPLAEPGSQTYYALFLDYENFGVEYSGYVNVENTIRICSLYLNDYHLGEVLLYMQNPQQVILERNGFYMNDFQSLDQVTSMSSDGFYQLFSRNESSSCIETPFEFWK